MNGAGQVSLHVIETLGRGGAERLLATVVTALAARGDQPVVAVMRAPYDLEPEITAAGVRVVRMGTSKRWSLLSQAKMIGRTARDNGAAIIHAHLYFPAITSCLCRVLRFSPASVIVTFHNLAYASGANRAGPGLTLKKTIARLLYPLGAKRLLAVSRSVADHYQSALGLSQIEVVHNGVDLSAMSAIQPVSRGNRLRIVTPGRLVREKGHALLLDALSESGLDYELVFVGGGPLEQALNDRAHSLGSANRLRITGTVDHGDLLSEVATADIVVIPSLHEGFGLTAVEAMALGRPVIASQAGGLPEVLDNGRAGRLFETGSVSSLTQSLIEMAETKDLRRRLGKSGPDRATAFSISTIIDRLRAIYAEAASEQDGRA